MQKRTSEKEIIWTGNYSKYIKPLFDWKHFKSDFSCKQILVYTLRTCKVHIATMSCKVKMPTQLLVP